MVAASRGGIGLRVQPTAFEYRRKDAAAEREDFDGVADQGRIDEATAQPELDARHEVRSRRVQRSIRSDDRLLRLREIRARHNNEIDLRTAPFVDAIDKIAICYQDLGIFP